MNGQINQIIAETHLSSLFSGLAPVRPPPCQNKKVCERRESGRRLKETIYYPTHIFAYFEICVSNLFALLLLNIMFSSQKKK